MSGETKTTAPAEKSEAPKPAAAPEPPKKGRSWVLFLVIAIVGGAGGYYWWSHRGLESTDDAQIDADLVAVPSRTTGLVTAIHFEDNQRVEAGDLLVELDSKPAEARLAQAEAELTAAKASAEAAGATADLSATNAKAGRDVAKAGLDGATSAVSSTYSQVAEADANVAAAKANRDKAKADLDRVKGLVDAGALPKSNLDNAQATFDAADANLSQATARVVTVRSNEAQAQAKVTEAHARLGQADTVDAQIAESKARAAAAAARVETASSAVELAKLDLSYTKIYAPRSGTVSKRSVAVGQMIGAGAPMLTIVGLEDLWVTANFKETQLAKMHLGQKVEMSVDAFGITIKGTIESFSGATGARFALLPPDNATGNFTKVVQRVPVKIHIDELPKNVQLLPGMSVELTVDTRK